MTRGLFITFEGGDGVGKTTQVTALIKHLTDLGDEVVQTREPGGTDLGVQIREILLHTRGDIHPRAEALLFAADRAHNINTRVRPALEAGRTVVQDRYVDSTMAYQGAGRTLDGSELLKISMWAADGLMPDLTILLDLDPAEAASRVAAGNKRFDRLEGEAFDFRVRLRQGFLDLAAGDPGRFLVLDANLPIEELSARIVDEVARRRANLLDLASA